MRGHRGDHRTWYPDGSFSDFDYTMMGVTEQLSFGLMQIEAANNIHEQRAHWERAWQSPGFKRRRGGAAV